MHARNLFLAALCILLAPVILLAPARGADIYVPDQYATIQVAIDLAVSGDTVIVRPGTYVENIDFNGKYLTVRSQLGPGATVIDGNKAGSVVTFQTGESLYSVIRGFTLTNGKNGSGGGILCSQSDPTIRDNVIIGNSSTYGGGIHCYGANPVIEGNRIEGNSTTAGGGICCHYSLPLIVSNLIIDNRAGWSGGIECAYGSDAIITNNTIVGNSANQGGGLYCMANSMPVVTNTIFWGNSAQDGPEIWIGKTADPSSVSISHSNVEGGQALVYVDPGCTLQWGQGMIDLDPLFFSAASGDFHLMLASPCRNGGTNTAPGLRDYDFEGDPRTAQGTVDIGADEFYFHLYNNGDVVPSGAINILVVGPPGAPVLLGLGSGYRNPPVPFLHGDLWIKLPMLKRWIIGPTPGSGVLVHVALVPPSWAPGTHHVFQALVGPWGGAKTKATNALIITVK